MTYIAIVLSAVIVFLLLHRPTKEKVKQVGNSAVGVCAAALERTSQKEARKNRVLELLAEHGDMGNEELRERLGVSARSVVNYMNELETDGRVE